MSFILLFFFSSRRRHTRSLRDWSSDVCSSDLEHAKGRPLLLMAPNWRGVTKENVAVARALAGEGYVVFVADMFGAGKGPKGTENPLEFLAPFIDDVAGTRGRIVAAFETMTAAAAARGIGDGTRRAAIGYCYGGSNVL